MEKETMMQYEIIRQSGKCNMFDYYCVTNQANKLELHKLASLTLEEYRDLLMNFSKYMKEFDIKQVKP